MTVLLVILSVLLLGGTALLASGRPLPVIPWRKDRAAPHAPTPSDGLSLVEPVAGLPPVLLPDVPDAGDVDAVRFGLGLRGYRMDQVDEVLDRLAAALEERDAVIRSLRSQMAAPTDVER